jgi:diguanylate cyclase (GGDEF)-like protein/PAS domain S-box-containing protein
MPQRILVEEEKRQITRILSVLISAAWAAYFFVVVTGAYLRDWVVTAVALSGCAFLVVPFILVRQGYVRTSSLMMILGAIGTVTMIATVGQGIRDLAIVAFPIILTCAALLLDRAYFRLCVGATLLAAGWLGAGEVFGWFIPKTFEGGLQTWILLVLIIVLVLIAALAVELLADRMRNNLEQAHQEIAQRKQVEDALRASTSRFDNLVQQIPVGVYQYRVCADGSTHYEYVSPKFCDFLDGDPEDLLRDPQSANASVHPDDLQRVIDANRAAALNVVPFHVEARYLVRGEIRWIQVAAIPIRLENGDSLWNGVATDITEQKRVEAELQKSEAQFRGIIDVSPVPMALNDDDHNITYLNAAFSKTYGYTLAEIPTLTDWWSRAYPDPEYRTWVMTTWQEHLDLARSVDVDFEPMEVNICCIDGSEKTAVVSAGALFEMYQGIHLVIFYDITERKLVEKELFRQKSLLSTVIDSSSAAIYAKDLFGRYVLINESGAKIMGHRRNEMIGHTDNELLPADTAAEIRQTDELAISSANIYEREETRVIDGTTYIFLAHKTPWRDDSGEIIGLIGVSTDITEFKKTEERLRFQSTHDALTGIYNRAFFEAEMERLVHGREQITSIIIADVDGLKRVNDSQGHAVGDDLLREAVKVLRSVFRASEVLARIGGDEFAVLLPGLTAATVQKMMDRVRDQLAQHNAVTPDFPVLLSVGAATAESNRLFEAFRIADQRMYNDKLTRKAAVNLPGIIRPAEQE